MLVSSAEGIIVEMIDNKSVTIGRKVDVEFEKERYEGGRGGVGGREG